MNYAESWKSKYANWDWSAAPSCLGPSAMSGASSGNASFFASPSTYESFGLATAEALLSGLPAVAFEDCPGTNVLIQDNIDGILVNGGSDRIEALSIALRRLMAAPKEIERLSRTGAQRLGAYSLPRVLDTWEDILRDAAQAKASMQFSRVKFP